MFASFTKKPGQRSACFSPFRLTAGLLMIGGMYCAPFAAFVERPAENGGAPTPAAIVTPMVLQLRFDSPAQRIEIQDQTIWHTLREEGFDNPVSSTPSSIRLIRRRGQLNDEQLRRIRDRIERGGFFDLTERYGAPPNERAYVYTLGINLDGRQHEVRFYSNPAYGPSPPAFSRLENDLTELLVEVGNWQASE